MTASMSPASRLVVAGCTIAAGVALYAWLRPSAVMFLPAGWHRPLAHGIPGWLLDSLPTFLHALALSLLTLAVIGTRRNAVIAAVCAAWCAIEIVFEVMQHAAVGAALISGLPAALTGTHAFAWLARFVRTGTFDPLDIAAAALGSLAAYAILAHRKATRSDLAEADHG